VQIAGANGHLSGTLLPRGIDVEPKRCGPNVVSVAFDVGLIVIDVISLRIMGVWIFARGELAVEAGHGQEVLKLAIWPFGLGDQADRGTSLVAGSDIAL
jgi:hypothetical protein